MTSREASFCNSFLHWGSEDLSIPVNGDERQQCNACLKHKVENTPEIIPKRQEQGVDLPARKTPLRKDFN